MTTDDLRKYRITFSIERAEAEGGNFVEVGFGSSSAWGTIAAAEHDMGSIIGCRQWETEGDMPDPDELEQS